MGQKQVFNIAAFLFVTTILKLKKLFTYRDRSFLGNVIMAQGRHFY